jgi:hypothetical protein
VNRIVDASGQLLKRADAFKIAIAIPQCVNFILHRMA